MIPNDANQSSTPVQPDLMSNGTAQAGAAPHQSFKLTKGLFITFEGGEGAGKTTQASRLANRLKELGLDAQLAREPGGTALGEQIRSIVKRDTRIGTAAETLLFVAARAQLVSELVKPRLRRKSIVIVDRFVDSTIAYQGYGRGMKMEHIATLNQIATGGLTPDLTVLLDADPNVTLSRVETTPTLIDDSTIKGERSGDRADERKFEREPLSFHEKVRQGYQELARDGKRWCVIRADQAQHRVADAIWKRVRPLLIERGADAEPLTRKQGVSSE